jgi:hypothetical protein
MAYWSIARLYIARRRNPSPSATASRFGVYIKAQRGPLDFLVRLASSIPSPRVNLTRFHGVFAANH